MHPDAKSVPGGQIGTVRGASADQANSTPLSASVIGVVNSIVGAGADSLIPPGPVNEEEPQEPSPMMDESPCVPTRSSLRYSVPTLVVIEVQSCVVGSGIIDSVTLVPVPKV